MNCTTHTPVLDSTGSRRFVSDEPVDDIEHRWICRQCGVNLSSDNGDGHLEPPPLTDEQIEQIAQVLVALGWDRMPSDHGRPVFHDGNELVRPLELVEVPA